MFIKSNSFVNAVLVDFGMTMDELLDEFDTDDPIKAASVLVYSDHEDTWPEEDIVGLEEEDCEPNFVIRYNRWTIGFGPSMIEEGSWTPYDVVEFKDEEEAKSNIKELKEN